MEKTLVGKVADTFEATRERTNNEISEIRKAETKASYYDREGLKGDEFMIFLTEPIIYLSDISNKAKDYFSRIFKKRSK